MTLQKMGQHFENEIKVGGKIINPSSHCRKAPWNIWLWTRILREIKTAPSFSLVWVFFFATQRAIPFLR